MNVSKNAMTQDDPSNGYEAVASEFMRQREQLSIGVATVKRWASSFTLGTMILDLGCGHGLPISAALVEDGFKVYGIDASPSLTAAFRRRFPSAHVACEPVEASQFFDQTFDGILAVGLMFLLSAEVQLSLIRKVASALNSGGRFLFTSPADTCTWIDILTNRQSLSLGVAKYKVALTNAGLNLVAEYVDEGGNHYFDACKE